MKPWLAAAATVVCAITNSVTGQAMSGSHTDIPRWCGKPYMAGSPNYNPGGMLFEPVLSPTLLLDVQLVPRHSIYVSTETTAEFILDVSFSRINGAAYSNATTAPYKILFFDIRTEENDQLLVSGEVKINTANNLIKFDVTKLVPRMHAYSIVLSGGATRNSATFSAKTELFYLPEKRTGSMVKIDNLNGGMLIANNVSNYLFEPLLPFGFYADCSGYLNLSFANVEAYKDFGFNTINPVCAFTDGDLDFLFDEMDQINLFWQYDMRGSFQNLTSVAEQIPLVQNHSSFLSYYTADEPDGWQYPLNSTRLAYNLITSMDKYHPVGLVLNCDNYYFKEYTSGADYIMEDAYPVGINATFSRPWNTTCNETYGDCGCDDCVGDLQDVSNRLDSFVDYQTWLGQWQKPLWAVPQAFSAEGYWSRDPTAEEAWTMNILALNHHAKGIMSWIFPPSATLSMAHSEMAKVVTIPPVSTLLLGDQPKAIRVEGYESIDVAYWTVGKETLVSIANADYTQTNATIRIPLPLHATNLTSQPWGSQGWKLVGNQLQTPGLDALATSMVILSIGG